MAPKYRILIVLSALVLLVVFLIYYLSGNTQDTAQLQLTKAVRHDLQVVVSTNGIIEPLDQGEIYAPLDSFVAEIPNPEGALIEKGRLLMRLEAREIRTALAEAKTALLEAKRQSQAVMKGAPKEEVSAVEASIAECELRLDQIKRDLQVEESLLSKKAATPMAVETLRKQQALQQLQLEALRQKKNDLQLRYSADEKELEQDRVRELSRQVVNLEQQLQMESVPAPQRGLIYSLLVKPGSYVAKGTLLARIYEPGKIRLRAFVDEPDLGRIAKGQVSRIEWDGMPNQQWTGVIETPAEQVVAMNNRSIGYVLCSIDGGSKALIPNLNVKVTIVTNRKANALSVPRSAVFNYQGKPAVLVMEGTRPTAKPVELGLVTSEEIEILNGINAGDSIVLKPGDAKIAN